MVYYGPTSFYVVTISFLLLCTGSVALRFAARKYASISNGCDDWLALIALVFTVAAGAILIAGNTVHGSLWRLPTNDRQTNDSLEELALRAKLSSAFAIVAIIGIGCIRLTLALFYRRIFRHTKIDILVWITIIVTICWTIGFFIASVLSCSWKFDDSNGTTLDRRVIKYLVGCGRATIWMPILPLALTASDTVIDTALLILPIGPICSSNMTNRRKASIIMIFAIGIFSVAASLIRLLLILKVAYNVKISLGVSDVPASNKYHEALYASLWWSYIEIGFGSLASNLPCTVGLCRVTAEKLLAQCSTRRGISPSGSIFNMSDRQEAPIEPSKGSQVVEQMIFQDV